MFYNLQQRNNHISRDDFKECYLACTLWWVKEMKNVIAMKFGLIFSIVIFKNKIPLTSCKRNVESTRPTRVTGALLTAGNAKMG